MAYLTLCCMLLLLSATSSSLAEDAHAHVEEEEAAGAAAVDRNTLPVSIPIGGRFVPAELLPANVMQMVATAGVVVLGVIAVALVLALVLPLFGVKLCYLLGTCEYLTLINPGGGGGGGGHGYDAYSNSATYNNPNPAYASPNYQRRSLEYVGPILKALSSAYDKYATPYLAKKN